MKPLRIAAAICLLLVGLSAFTVTVEASRYLRTLNAVTAELPKVAQAEIAATREALRAEIQATRAEALAALERIGTRTDARAAALQSDALARLDAALARADSRLGEMTATVEGIWADARPVLTAATAALNESAATVKDARDTMDALYPDVQALVDTADVAARSVSETMGAVEKAAPRITAATAQNTENIAGITHDAHVLTERLTRPATKKQKVWEAVKVAALVARFL